MLSGDDWLRQRLKILGLDPEPEQITLEDAQQMAVVERYFEEHPEAHQAARVNPFTGEPQPGHIFERREITDPPQHGPYIPELMFPKGFLDWLKTEMKYNPEMREQR